jgi:hypothetical protein
MDHPRISRILSTGVIVLVSSVLLAGCNDAERGALIGASLGATAGYLIGDACDDHHHYRRHRGYDYYGPGCYDRGYHHPPHYRPYYPPRRGGGYCY